MNEEKILSIISKTFETDIDINDYDKNITTVIQWESFYIVSMLTEIMEITHKNIDLEKLFLVKTLRELVELIKEETGE